ncbi:MAG: succinate dehydrogenase, hydrophobic membrane anchor protein [Marinovum sp.]|nr:succinate dehydrogenase, hydrophobic membrane anchor protein [Marinovum sp.]
MRYLTDRKRALGHGSGRAGTHHHWQMVGSSIALLPMIPLFVFVFGAGFGGSYEEVVAYFSQPIPAITVGLSLTVIVLHLTHEAKAAVEDYMHGAVQKLTLLGLGAFAYTLIAIGLFALARMAL